MAVMGALPVSNMNSLTDSLPLMNRARCRSPVLRSRIAVKIVPVHFFAHVKTDPFLFYGDMAAAETAYLLVFFQAGIDAPRFAGVIDDPGAVLVQDCLQSGLRPGGRRLDRRPGTPGPGLVLPGDRAREGRPAAPLLPGRPACRRRGTLFRTGAAGRFGAFSFSAAGAGASAGGAQPSFPGAFSRPA